MLVHAATEFLCDHLYVVTARSSRFMLVCDRCGHRAEFLALGLRRSGAQVIAFPQSRDRMSVPVHGGQQFSPTPLRFGDSSEVRRLYEDG
jgi:hypothetical protein